MSSVTYYYCDNCDQQGDRKARDITRWLVVTGPPRGSEPGHFCSLVCLAAWATKLAVEEAEREARRGR